jgi:hypothetical protein
MDYQGLCYAFIGVLGLEENETSTLRNPDSPWFKISSHFVKVIAWAMLGCGVLYFSMGIFCLQLIYNKVRNDFEERLLRAKDVERAIQTYGTASGSKCA